MCRPEIRTWDPRGGRWGRTALYVCAVTFACTPGWITRLWEGEWSDGEGSGQEKTLSECSRNLVHLFYTRALPCVREQYEWDSPAPTGPMLQRRGSSYFQMGLVAAQEEEIFPPHPAGSYLGEVRGHWLKLGHLFVAVEEQKSSPEVSVWEGISP